MKHLMRVSLGIATLAVSVPALAAINAKELYKKAGPAVVLFFGSDGGSNGSGGTGSIITGDGKVITNAHVVVNSSGQPYKNLYVYLKPAKITGDNSKDLVNRYKARVISVSPASELDLALVQIENPPPNLPTIAFADPDDVEIGDEVVAIGHPEQGGLWTLTSGTISTVIANFNRIGGKNVFQTDASINRGNSGGPLLNEDGNMVGINTMIARVGEGGVAITGVNYSLKSSVAVRWMAAKGMNLAYAAPPKTVVAVNNAPATAPTSTKPAAEPQVTATKPMANTPPPPPPSAITLVDDAPKSVASLKQEGASLARDKQAKESMIGQRLEPSAVKPKILTDQRPFNMDDLRARALRELEDMMNDMRGKTRGNKKSGNGMGLW